MPIYEYEAAGEGRGCDFCRGGFEQPGRMSEPPLAQCPRCAAPVRRRFSVPALGASKAGFDDRARSAGFHKLKRLGKGEYEKQY